MRTQAEVRSQLQIQLTALRLNTVKSFYVVHNEDQINYEVQQMYILWGDIMLMGAEGREKVIKIQT